MRLLLITNVYPTPRRPTKGTFNGEMVAGLRDAGDDVRVIVPTPWTDLIRTRANGSPPAGVSTPTWWYPPRTAHHTHHRWMGRSVMPAAEAMTSDWHPDAVLGYWAHPDGAVAANVAARLGVPCVLLVGGSDVQILTRDPARRAVVVDTLRRADRVLAVGEPLREATIALGVDRDHVGTFARGVDSTRFHPASPRAARERLDLPLDRPVVVWVGRMVAVKGLDVLLDAWRQVAAHPSRPLLLLLGDGELRSALERQAAPLDGSVRFIGPVPHAALPDWYRAADVAVLPSRSEGVPNVLLEALACGTPFVASAVGGVGDLVGAGSRTVPAEDPAALAAALIASISSPPMQVRTAQVIPDRRDAVAALRAEILATLHHTAPLVNR